MKKLTNFTICITMIATMMITLTACGDKEKKSEETTKAKTTTTKAQTTVINVTDTNGVAVTNTDGKAVTEVVKVNGTTKKVETTKATTSTATTTAPTTKAKVATTRATTTARPTTTVPQTTARPTTTAPTTTVQANPYGYVNAWGSIATMENDCKVNAESMGMTYRTDYTLESGHWITPYSSYGAPSTEAFKKRMLEDIAYEKNHGTTNIRILLVTMDNYQDGRCGKYTDNALMYLNGDNDKIVVYIVTTN